MRSLKKSYLVRQSLSSNEKATPINYLKNIRVLMGVTKKEFSEAIGVDEFTYSRYENKSRTPRLSVCYEIIDFAATKGVRVDLRLLLPRSDWGLN